MIFSIYQQFFAPTSRDIFIKKRILVDLGQIFAMAFAQRACREWLRDIEARLRAQARRLHRRGFRCQTVSRNPLPNANAARPWQIRAGCAQHLIGRACPLYSNEPSGVDLYATACAFDAATIDPRLSAHGKPKRPCLAPVDLRQGRSFAGGACGEWLLQCRTVTPRPPRTTWPGRPARRADRAMHAGLQGRPEDAGWAACGVQKTGEKIVGDLYTAGGVLVDFPLMRLVFNRLAQVLLLAARGGLRAVRVAATDLEHWKVGQRWADPWSMQNEISFKENHASSRHECDCAVG